MPAKMVNEIGSVLGLNTVTLAISFTGIEMVLKIILLLVSIVYTVSQIIKSRKK
tara:strand:- start:2459 stop:2620 length:162 start_codon:yes stop_codon:yes gene_type:complete